MLCFDFVQHNKAFAVLCFDFVQHNKAFAMLCFDFVQHNKAFAMLCFDFVQYNKALAMLCFDFESLVINKEQLFISFSLYFQFLEVFLPGNYLYDPLFEQLLLRVYPVQLSFRRVRLLRDQYQ